MFSYAFLAEELGEVVANYGPTIGIIGIALCVILCGVGSGLGLFKTASAASGILGENPKKYGKLMVLVLLPATQGIYGFLIGIIASGSAGALASTVAGWQLFAACLPMAISGFVSGLLQGKAAANCIYAVGKQDSLSGKLIVYPAMIEFYAILGLIISIMLI